MVPLLLLLLLPKSLAEQSQGMNFSFICFTLYNKQERV